MSENKYTQLKLIKPSFDSNVTDLIIELEKLRDRKLTGSTPPSIFFQLKSIFHTLESIGSSRIEGNNTTLAEYIETKINSEIAQGENIKEIKNIEKAMEFIEENIEHYSINRMFLSEIHKMVVDGLTPAPNGEGDKNPGEYRNSNVAIAKSNHLPPEVFKVNEYMDELFDFINAEDSPKYDLLKTAIAHHRFVWIHPFGNGNGRTVRLLTYAMLVKQGFSIHVGRIINPTAVFCSNRDDYYNFLGKADLGTEEGLLEWCQYVLKGLKEEIEKIDKLLDYEYLKKEVLIPTLEFSLENKYINKLEFQILKRTVEKAIIQAGDLDDIIKSKNASEKSRQIKNLIEKKMLMPEKEGARKYSLRFDNNYLFRGIMQILNEKGFLPIKD